MIRLRSGADYIGPRPTSLILGNERCTVTESEAASVVWHDGAFLTNKVDGVLAGALLGGAVPAIELELTCGDYALQLKCWFFTALRLYGRTVNCMSCHVMSYIICHMSYVMSCMRECKLYIHVLYIHVTRNTKRQINTLHIALQHNCNWLWCLE